jgi:predicted RNA-binding Zn-ribbon protein involved in translation (DUF1610 family)
MPTDTWKIKSLLTILRVRQWIHETEKENIMAKLVCTECQTELKPSHNGTLVIETASFGPYKVWAADTWKCPGCGVEIVAGFSDEPIRQDHYAKDFAAWLTNEISISSQVVYDHGRPQEKTKVWA